MCCCAPGGPLSAGRPPPNLIGKAATTLYRHSMRSALFCWRDCTQGSEGQCGGPFEQFAGSPKCRIARTNSINHNVSSRIWSNRSNRKNVAQWALASQRDACESVERVLVNTSVAGPCGCQPVVHSCSHRFDCTTFSSEGAFPRFGTTAGS